jgi:hypothetical protein
VETATTAVSDKLDYNKIRAEAADLWARLTVNPDGTPNEEMARRVQKRIEMVFGRVIRLSEITEDQVDLFNLVLLDMRDLVSEL